MIFASGEVQPWNDVSNINAQEHAAEIEREANSFQNRRTRGPILNSDFGQYDDDDDLIY